MSTPYELATARLAEAEQQRQGGRQIFPEGCSSLDEALVYYEAAILRKALTLKSGQLIGAAKVLGISYQGLRYILDTRQQTLAPLATPKRRRNRKRRHST